MFRMLFMSATILAAIASTSAGETVVPAGPNEFTYDGQYWRSSVDPSVGYVRTQIWTPPYYANGYYYAGAWNYRYVPTPGPAAASYAGINSTDPKWRLKLIDLAKARDEINGQRLLAADEQKAFLDSLEAMGLKNGFGLASLPATPGFGLYTGNAAYGKYGVSGNTLYGYAPAQAYGQTLNTSIDSYSQVNLDVLLQGLLLSGQQTRELAGDMNRGITGVVSDIGANQRAIAELRLKLAAVVAAQPSARTVINNNQFRFQVNPQGQIVPVPVQPEVPEGIPPPPVSPPGAAGKKLSAEFVNVLGTRCSSCHSGPKAQAGFDISRWPQLTPDEKAKVWSRIILPLNDPKKMPRDKDLKTGIELPLEEKKMFFQN